MREESERDQRVDARRSGERKRKDVVTFHACLQNYVSGASRSTLKKILFLKNKICG